MIIDDLNKIDQQDIFAIIIGSGPAGITTAIELEKKKIKTLLIEAGGIKPNNDAKKFLQGSTIGDEYNDLSICRLRQFGGASGLWGGNCNPLNNENFNDWPIKKNDLETYEGSAKKILNLRYKENFYLENLSDNLDTYNLVWSNVNFAKKYFNHIKKSKYIYLSLNTALSELIGNSKTINSINCIKNNKRINLKSKYYILSCGGIENSRLLLWSKEKNKEIFDDKLPIGQYYMDHPYYSIGEGLVLYEKFISYFKRNNLNNIPILTCKNLINISANNEFIKKNKILNVGLYLNFEKINDNNNLFKQVRCVAPNFIKNIYENSKVKEKYKISIDILQEQKAISNNKIELSDKKDPFGVPYPLIYWKKSELEKKSARLIAEDLSKLFIDNDIGRISLSENLYNTEDYSVIAGNHQLGGTRIGSNENDSVVDKNLKVHDKNNLFVNGSSIFRTGGHSHPTFTIVKLASRLANHLSILKS
jgi:hypothetical protein